MTLPPIFRRLLPALPHPVWAWWWLAPLAVLGGLGYVLIGMAVSNIIDDDPAFGPQSVAASQSRTVDLAARLIYREVDQHKWVANDPFFKASYWLDDMPNYQQGIVGAVANFTAAMVSAAQGQGADPSVELERAAGLLKYPGTIWKFDPSISWAPTASSEKQYRTAARNLDDMNRRLLAGSISLDRSAVPLTAVLNAVIADLGRNAESIGHHLDDHHSALFDGGADDLYFANKGRLYAYALLLREWGWDHAQILAERNAGEAWRAMVETLLTAAAPRPSLILNGSADSGLVPNHLTYQGFYLLLAHERMLELAHTLSDR